jgi:hypothetical protein
VSEKARYRFLVSWLLILTVGVSILSWESLTRYVGREQRIVEWNARMIKDSLDRVGIPAKIDSVVRLRMSEQSFLQFDGVGFSELAKQGAGYLIAAVFGMMMWLQWKYYTRLEEKREERNERREKEYNDANLAVANALTRLSVIIEPK